MLAAVTATRLKYDSFAMWQAKAALCPKTTSSTTGFLERTASKKFQIPPIASLAQVLEVSAFCVALLNANDRDGACTGERFRPAYFTGNIRCSYGVSAHIT